MHHGREQLVSVKELKLLVKYSEKLALNKLSEKFLDRSFAAFFFGHYSHQFSMNVNISNAFELEMQSCKGLNGFTYNTRSFFD